MEALGASIRAFGLDSWDSIPGFDHSSAGVSSTPVSSETEFWINGWWGPALITSAWWGDYGGCWTYRPVYDGAGAYLGYNYVNICS